MDLKRGKSSTFIFHHCFNVIKDSKLKLDWKNITDFKYSAKVQMQFLELSLLESLLFSSQPA